MYKKPSGGEKFHWRCIILNIKPNYARLIAGTCAGAVNGLLGAGGGMVLIPLLGLSKSEEHRVFSSSVAMILPICLVSLAGSLLHGAQGWREALPYLPGSALGGYLAGKWSDRIPDKWLHRAMGILMLWGGVRNLC